MEIEEVDIVIFFLFLIVSVIILILVGSYLVHRQKNYDSDVLLSFFYSKISFEWKFLDEVMDELFSEKDQELHDVLTRIFGETYKMQTMQLIIVEQLCTAFLEKGLLAADKVLYSKEEFDRFPFLFKNLPEWRKEDCKALVESKEEGLQGFDLIRVRKIPIGKPKNKKLGKERSFLGEIGVPALS